LKDIDHQNSDQGFNDEFEKNIGNKEFLMMNLKNIGK
jgi:hypothetical protein